MLCFMDPAVHFVAQSIADAQSGGSFPGVLKSYRPIERQRSEEHTSELQSQSNLVCRLLLEKKKKNINHNILTYSIIHYLLSTYYIILLVLTHISLYRPPCIHDT